MSDTLSVQSWGLRGIATVAMFIGLNQFFGTGSMEGLLEASWGQPLTWGAVLLGMLASAFLVEAFRRADWKSPRWFVEVFGIIGGYVVIEDIASNLLDPALDPVLDPVFEGMPTWMLPVLVVFMLVMGAFAVTRTTKRYWGND